MHKQLGKKQSCQESHLLWLSLGHKLQVVFFFFNRVHFYTFQNFYDDHMLIYLP